MSFTWEVYFFQTFEQGLTVLDLNFQPFPYCQIEDITYVNMLHLDMVCRKGDYVQSLGELTCFPHC